ncbi:hypothetical protein PAB09_07185 [Corynebacterium sp. SCR221107]|uniref:Rv1476 family membrane protein n=1 Tax=Corynebacterium sp. SCR221107 TaxID=3017361 RepID=UPI0022EC83C5|nr:DUF6676 family protein [Corynebacterium sp. SCR221107]WBT07726.1 hypothetical protein PAB09_07185 [Corynebacterium sp. SCR221107]
MVPESVDVAALVGELSDDQVAIDAAMNPDVAAGMGSGLKEAIAYAQAQDFGSLGFVAFDADPGQHADVRDIAQVLLDDTGLDTVIVRAPGNGAIVSDLYSRAEIEAAQQEFFATADYPAATKAFVDTITHDTVADQGIVVTLIATLVLGVVLTLSLVRRLGAPGRLAERA